jgi:DNA-binding MarR family transcriptional regulator
MQDFFLKEKPVMALVTIRRSRDDIYCSKISKKIDTTYAHTVKVVSRMEDEGLVESKKDGRKKILELTSTGQEFADQFIEIIEEFEEDKRTDSPIEKNSSL